MKMPGRCASYFSSISGGANRGAVAAILAGQLNPAARSPAGEIGAAIWLVSISEAGGFPAQSISENLKTAQTFIAEVCGDIRAPQLFFFDWMIWVG